MDEQAKKDKQKDYRLRNTYGITLEEYNKILLYQNNCCAICKKPFDATKKSFACDHSHTSGLVRGLLDWQCNKALAFFRDDPKRFLAAAEYLTNPPATIALGGERITTPGGDSKKRRKLMKKLRDQKCQTK